MVKICKGPCRRPSSASLKQQDKEGSSAMRTEQPKARDGLSYLQPNSASESPGDVPYTDRPHVHLAAIDNSLSFPIHHPNSWRSYCYGWLFLPSSLIGAPFSAATREYFLPLLTDPMWWQQTVLELHKLFSIDDDFSEKMFRRQISLMKGQAWNVVKSLRNPEEGPLELCRRKPCLVHDEELVVADDEVTREMLRQAISVPPSIGNAEQSSYRPGMARNQTTLMHVAPRDISAAFSPPSFQRHSSERHSSFGHSIDRAASPLPTSKHVDLSRQVYGSASGVSVMNYMERLQRKEEAAGSGQAETSYDDTGDEGEGYGSTGWSRSRARNERQGASLDLDREALMGLAASGRTRSGSIDEAARRRSETVEVALPTGSRAVDVLPTVLPGSATKTVIVQVSLLCISINFLLRSVSSKRLEHVDARPFFAKF